MHEVRYNVPSSRLLLVASGFWDDAELAAFMINVRSAFAALAKGGRAVAILADLRNLPPQSQQVFGDPGFLAASAAIRIEKHGVVTTSALSRLQFRRLFAGIPTEFFDDREAALAWLEWNASDPFLNTASEPTCGGARE